MVQIASVPAALSMASESTQSAEEQIVRLKADIQDIKNYLQPLLEDYAKRRGLLSKVSRRRKLLDQLKRESRKRYN